MLTWSDIIEFTLRGNPEPDNRLVKTDVEWKAQLSHDQYRITRGKNTEMAGTGAFCHSFESGTYHCVCCDTPLFDSSIKYESRSGWPSFTQPVKANAIKYEKDSSYGMVRVEISCNVCDAHLGHVFPDGPPPSGLRYCVNSASIKMVTNGNSKS
ncbi:MAG TPA: peptide-methionine (R)-S-oxide reductase MsrB [Aquaticitalea sp.]|nr:peptide-methionine (R)-S-oxide reductase MsrB [Aquaticitalea sp.]HNU60415.1 peptide-methionine (R)-S-oxide reductase MsrB [Aquaticitalea sp.]